MSVLNCKVDCTLGIAHEIMLALIDDIPVKFLKKGEMVYEIACS